MTLEQRLSALVAAIGGDIKNLLSTRGNLAALTTTEKASLVGAINELQAEIQSLGSSGSAVIDDNAGAGNTTAAYSADKVLSLIQASQDALLGGVGSAYDTLKELADELTDQDSALDNLITAVGNTVRFTPAQGLTSEQQGNARANIGAQSAAEIGNPDADLAAVYATAKA